MIPTSPAMAWNEPSRIIMNPANEIQPAAHALPSPCDIDIDFPPPVVAMLSQPHVWLKPAASGPKPAGCSRR